MSIDHEYRSKDAFLASAGVLFAPAGALQDPWIPECACSPSHWIESHLCWASTPSREEDGRKIQDIGYLSDLEKRRHCQTCRRLFEILKDGSEWSEHQLLSLHQFGHHFAIFMVSFVPPDV
jgi:hypothetical protein